MLLKREPVFARKPSRPLGVGALAFCISESATPRYHNPLELMHDLVTLRHARGSHRPFPCLCGAEASANQLEVLESRRLSGGIVFAHKKTLRVCAAVRAFRCVARMYLQVYRGRGCARHLGTTISRGVVLFSPKSASCGLPELQTLPVVDCDSCPISPAQLH